MRLHSYAFAIAILLHVPVGGDADERAEATGQESKRERLRAEALERARSIRVALPGNGSAVPLVEDPVLRFGDPARENEDGSLWYWGASGRPLVFAEIYRSSVNLEVLWVHAMSLTSTQLVSAQTD